MPTLAPGTATISLDIVCSLPVISDINTFWKMQIAGSPSAIAYDIQADDAQIVVTGLTGPALVQPSTPTYYFNKPQVQATVTIAIGSVILCDGEEMYVSGIDGPDVSNDYTLQVTRGINQTLLDGTVTTFPNAAAVDHPAGGTISILQFVTPWDMIRQTLLIPGVLKIVSAFGADSAVFVSSANGSVTLPSGS